MQPIALVTLFALFLAFSPNSRAATYYVATNGSDANPGTLALPFATPQKAVATNSALAAGDTVYVRGGTYVMNVQVKPNKTGAAGNPIKLWAYPGETPVFDFSGMGTTDKALDVRRDYWHVRGLTVRKAPSNGIFVGGNGVIIENCVIHDCNNDGLVLGSSTLRATNALILNCDSYRNYQAGSGGNNGDGFAAKDGCATGNAFIGCRAWDNADDGWDFYNNNNNVLISNCWAFSNGYDLWGVGAGWTGNGNGFKLGGAGTTGRHTVIRSVAFDNRAKGFDHNNGVGAHWLHQNTGFRNGKWNFSFYDQPVNGNHDFRNNLSYLGQGGTNFIIATSVQVSNSWPAYTATAGDFVTLDAALATAARNPDGALPDNGFARLASGSQFIDRGINLGLPFDGAAPDLGAFEVTAAAPQGPLTISTPALINGNFQFTTSGLTAHGNVIVHSSTNLTHWQPIFTNPPVTGAWQFIDSNAAAHPQRYYRTEEK